MFKKWFTKYTWYNEDLKKQSIKYSYITDGLGAMALIMFYFIRSDLRIISLIPLAIGIYFILRGNKVKNLDKTQKYEAWKKQKVVDNKQT